MIPFLAIKGIFGLARGWWLAIAAAGLVALYFGVNGLLDRMTDNAKEQGATEQREANHAATITNVEKANDAAEKVRRDPDAARDECLRNSRNPANC